MFEKMKEWRDRRAERAEIEALSEGDLLDLGLGRDQLRALVETPKDVGERVHAMAKVFGVTDADLTADRGNYVDILCTCSGCRDRSACAHELAKGTAARPEDCGFCLNTDEFDRMAGKAAGVL